MIDQPGRAAVDRGEAVIPEPIVSAAESDTGPNVPPPEPVVDGASGGAAAGDTVDVTVESIRLVVDKPGFDPGDLSRSEVRSLASRLSRELGRETNKRAGTR
jgi:hypothetical protein